MQLHEFLVAQGSRCFCPSIGGSGGASVVANALSGGHGVGPAPRRADAVGSLTMVLSDGTRVTTGYEPGSAFRGSEAHGHRLPSFGAGSFHQGVARIVVAMTIRLERRPALLVPFHGVVGEGKALAALIEALRLLLFDGALGRTLVTVWNRYKFMGCRSDFPWSALAENGALDLARLGLRRDWLLSGAIYAGSLAQAVASQAAMRSLEPLLESLSILHPDEPTALAAAPGFLGSPTERNLRSAYWRKRSGLPAEPSPELDRCGLLQICPLVSMTAAGVAVLQEIETKVVEHGFEPQMGFDATDPRTIEAFVTVAWDRDSEGADAAAMACYYAVAELLLDRKIPRYRIGVQDVEQDSFGRFIM